MEISVLWDKDEWKQYILRTEMEVLEGKCFNLIKNNTNSTYIYSNFLSMQWIYGIYTSEKNKWSLTFDAWENIFAEKFVYSAGITKEKMSCCFPVQVSNFKFLTLKTNAAVVYFT